MPIPVPRQSKTVCVILLLPKIWQLSAADLGQRQRESQLCILLEAVRYSKSNSRSQNYWQFPCPLCKISSNCLPKTKLLKSTSNSSSISKTKTKTILKMSWQVLRLGALFVDLACCSYVYLQSYAQCHHSCNQS